MRMKMKMKKKDKTQIPMKYSNNENEINPSRMKNGIPSLPVPPPPRAPIFKVPRWTKKRKRKRKQIPSIKMPIEVNDDNTNAVEMVGN